MTRQEANKIKKILKKENAVFTSTAGYYDGGKKELRVKVVEFLITGYAYGYVPKNETCEQKKADTQNNIIKVLRALERNGLRPEYRIEQREISNAVGRFDCRYVIFN